MTPGPEQASASLMEASEHLQKGKAAAANRLLRQVFSNDFDPLLKRGLELWRSNRPRGAATALGEYSASNPGDFRALQVQAHIAVRAGALDEAISLLLQCLELHPEIMALRPELASLMIRRQRHAEAEAVLEPRLQQAPHDIETMLLKSALLDRSGQYAEAAELLQAVIERQSPRTGTATDGSTDLYKKLAANHTALAMIQRTMGEQAVAIETLRQAIRLDPASGWPWFQLADLKVHEFQPEEVEAIRQGLDRAEPGSMNEVHFAFALGRALESRNDVDGAFAAYARGNRTRQALAPYDMEALQREFAAIKTVFSGPGLQASVTHPSTECPVIFVTGLPRSGTTLVDQIITAHSQVDGTMELPIVSTLVRELQQRQIKAGRVPYPAPGTELQPEELESLGRQYLQRAQIQRGSAPFFVDKMPFNFQHVGLIRMILPGARIVNVSRHPMALGFSIFRQLFRFGQDWAFDLSQIARYYLAYSDLVHFWERQMPGSMIQVRYETLVGYPEASIGALLQQLELPEEPACFAPHENRRPVRTASSEQVRRPLHTAAVEYWRLFENHLEPLRLALGPAATTPPDTNEPTRSS